MKYITRFNPTANGELHLGHVYIALFNEHMARSTGGKFYVRFEDNQVDTLYNWTRHQINGFRTSQHETMEWLGIEADGYLSQSGAEQEVKEFIAHHGWYIPEYRWPYSIPLNPVLGDYDPERGEWFPYAPHITFHKVIYDELSGINVLIRGDDLRSEFALYQNYRKWFRLADIPHYYMPRLYGPDGEIISKLQGARSVNDYMDAGWSAADVIDLLAQSALKEPSEGWHIHNVRRYPRLDPAFSISV